MNDTNLIPYYVFGLRILPIFMLLGISFSYFLDKKNYENFVILVVRFCSSAYLIIASLLFISFLLTSARLTYIFGDLEIFSILSCRYYLDWFSCTFIFVSSIVAFLTLFFAGRMLHREPGFARFFIGSSILVFGMTLILTARDFDLLFAGWEFLGMSSFIMIGFYRDRINAAKHATRAMTYFRISDLGLLVGVFIVHTFGEGFEDFAYLNQQISLNHLTSDHFFWLSFFLLVSATGKSAQFPFSHWLPRAMEGPSNSSSIFYGAISIHMGVFLLIRTSNIWQENSLFRMALFAIGIFSFIHALLISFFQTNIKSKIAWNSIGHLGLMFVELSFNLQTVCMIHVILNAISKSTQYLTASSALILEARLVHLHKRKFFKVSNFSTQILKVIQNEFYFDFWFKYLIRRPYLQIRKPFSKYIDKYKISSLDPYLNTLSILLSICTMVFTILIDPHSSSYQNFFTKNSNIAQSLLMFGCLFLILSILRFHSLRSFYTYSHLAVFMISMSALFIGEKDALNAFLAFNFGTSFGYLLINLCLIRVFSQTEAKPDESNGFYGLGESLPWIASIAFVGSMSTICMPITSSFFGEDFLLELAHKQYEFPVFIAGLGVFIIQIASILAIAKLYFGYQNSNFKTIRDLNPKTAILLLGLCLIFCVFSLWKFKLLIH